MFRSNVLVCGGTGCTSSNSLQIAERLKEEIKAKGLDKEVNVITTGCFGLCALGPIMVVYPEGSFYSMVKIDDIPEIVEEHLLKGRIVTRLLYQETVVEDTIKSLNKTAFYAKQKRVALRNCGVIDPEKIDDYIARDGYEALIDWLIAPGSKWDLKPMKEKWYAFRYGNGKIAIAGAEDLDKEFDVPTGYFTMEYRDEYDYESGTYVPTLQKVCHLVYLVFAKDKNGGCELSEIAIKKDSGGFRIIPVSEFEGELEVQPMLEVKEDFCKTYIPISDTYMKLNKDTLQDIRLEYMDIKDIPEIKDTDGDGRSTHNTVTVNNIYGYELDITDLITNTYDDEPEKAGITSIAGAKVVLSNT
ncbi:MAG: NAD(P)H-dependent oxidoreductase subunit E, partial [Clostridia bacterium]|nr:NAD(P)H-dependent oxidoreductase subunit E [Clostridia bacterium]